jgi:steroid 5-alpha reductase family enzyme
MIVAIAIWTYVTALFIVSLIIKRNDIADIAWGPGIAIVGIMSILFSTLPSLTHIFIVSATTLWALRLAVRIGLRNSKKSEDPRYAQWRTAWGKWFFIRSYLQVYLLQGALMLIMGYPFLHVAIWHDTTSTFFLAIGMILWLGGFLTEVVADHQLDRFISDPRNRGHILQTGLWKYSRHPNYFGEVTLWWGIWITIIPVSYGLYALVSPLLITILITTVSGIPMAERTLKDHPEFHDYKKRTSAFFLLPPKK